MLELLIQLDEDKCNKDLRESLKRSVIPLDIDEQGDYIQAPIETTTQRRRDARKYIHKYSIEILERGKENSCPASDSGPLMKRLLDLCPFGQDLPKVRRDSCSSFLFAGQDTTANLMTHFVFEMARNPAWQRKIQAEVDKMFNTAQKEKIEIEYENFKQLLTMKRCINETL